MAIFNIDKILYYGRYYSNERQGYKTLWWFCLDDFEVYDTQKLIEQYAYANCKEIISSEKYIPLFRTDIVSLEKRFIKEHGFHDLKIQDYQVNDYDVAFKIFIDRHFLTKQWYEFERKQLYNDAVKWCKENGISFKSE